MSVASYIKDANGFMIIDPVAARAMSRVELMRAAIAFTRDPSLNQITEPLAGRLDECSEAEVAGGIAHACGVIAEHYQAIDQTMSVEPDYAGTPFARSAANDQAGLPTAILITNGQGGQRVPLVWTERSLTIDRRTFRLSSPVIAFGSDFGWEHLVEALEKVITDFFDQHQPTAVAS